MKIILLLLANLFSIVAFAQTHSEKQTERYFESIKSQPKKLAEFLAKMPKGGDLHNHDSGATYAENMLSYAYADNLCVDRKTYIVFSSLTCESQNLLDNAIEDKNFKDALIDAWSMRHFTGEIESGHDHFFSAFGKFNLIANMHRGEVLSEVVDRAGGENEQYLELMVTPDNDASGVLGKQLGWNPDLNVMRNKLLSANFDKIVTQISNNLDQNEAKKNSLLACDTQQAHAGCRVNVRYLYQVLREQAPEMVFAQLLAGFESASKDKRIVGVNMVQPEDGKISMGDYKLHMQMVSYLHQLYPNVHISLHAGELSGALVPTEGLKFHINDAVNVAHANRIGHGIDIAQEDNSEQLLNEMAAQHVMVEINLSSNAKILNVDGANHPLPLYMSYGVPVALSTDDEGIDRSNLTKEFQHAVDTFNLSYSTLKNFVRNSIEYSFLAGKAVWKDGTYQQLVTECEKDSPGANLSLSCQNFIDANEKANAQWELEKRMVEFENEIT